MGFVPLSSSHRRVAAALALVALLIVGASLAIRLPDEVQVARPSQPASIEVAAAAPSSSSGTPVAEPSVNASARATGATPAANAATPAPTPAAPRATLAPTPVPTARPATTPPPTTACALFPSSNVWNKRVDGLPVAANSSTLVATIGSTAHLHPDFGSYLGYGIPYNVVGSSTPRVRVSFQYADESDSGPYPIPANPKIEAGSDRHLLMWDTAGCKLYELYAAVKTSSGWRAGSGAIWDLRSNALRPDGWTSADAAGLPILPGLVRYGEVASGVIRHAIRFTAPETRDMHIYPARHDAGIGNASSLPPMGLRVRLKAAFPIGGFSPRMRVILTAMKRYGMILADNGSPWYFTGTSDARWSDDELNELKSLVGTDFEVVNTAGFMNG
jgi:hypothetical protein